MSAVMTASDMSRQRQGSEHGVSDRQRWVALYVLCLGMLMIVLDATVVNVALPSIQNSLHFSNSGLAWVVNSYLVAFGGFLLLAGRLGDLVGRRSMFLSGLTLFTIASAACGLAQSQTVLIASRFVQGIGGALTSAVILGMIVTMFPEGGEQARAIGVFAFVASAGGAVGLLAGGILTQAISWHWIFFVNLPIGVVTLTVARRLVDKDEGIGLRAGADVPGAVLITTALMLSVYTLVKPAAELGWGATRTLVLGAASLLLLTAFVVRQAVAARPLMPLRIFRSRNVVGGNLIEIFAAAGMFSQFFLGALYLQRVRHYDALQIGFAFMPVAVVMGVLSVRYAEPLATRFGARRVAAPGLLLIAAGLALFAVAPVHAGYLAHIFPVMVLLGAGAGLCFPAIMSMAMSGIDSDDAGLASGLLNTTAQVGGALGLALLATLSSGRTSHLRATGHSQAAALTSGYHLAFWVAVGLVLLAVVTVLTVVQPAAKTASDSADEDVLEAPVAAH